MIYYNELKLHYLAKGLFMKPKSLLVANGCALRLHQIGTYLCLPLLTLLIFVDVLLRYLFQRPLTWSLEVSSLLVFVMFIAGLPHCSSTGRHIRLAIFYPKLTGVPKRVVRLVHALSGFLFALFFSWETAISIGEQMKYAE